MVLAIDYESVAPFYSSNLSMNGSSNSEKRSSKLRIAGL